MSENQSRHESRSGITLKQDIILSNCKTKKLILPMVRLDEIDDIVNFCQVSIYWIMYLMNNVSSTTSNVKIYLISHKTKQQNLNVYCNNLIAVEFCIKEYFSRVYRAEIVLLQYSEVSFSASSIKIALYIRLYLYFSCHTTYNTTCDIQKCLAGKRKNTLNL